MAKKILTQANYDVDNVQQLPVQVKGQASLVQQTFDKASLDQKTYNNTTLLTELQSETLNDSGAHAIGLNVVEITAKNVADGMKENRDAIAGAILGQIPDNTLTEAKMAAEMKKQAGGVAEFDTVTANKTILDINRIAKLDSGVADAYVVTTDGTFSRTDGNILNFIPNNNNTGASTINEDGNGVVAIQKYVDGAWVALEEGDLKKFQQVQLVWNQSESAFQLAPKGGANIFDYTPKGAYVGAQESNLLITVTGSGSLLTIGSATSQTYSIEIDGVHAFDISLDARTSVTINGKYTTGYKIYCNSSVAAMYTTHSEDKTDVTKGTPTVNLVNFPAYVAQTLRLSVSGKGLVSGLITNTPAKIDIDGAELLSFGNITSPIFSFIAPYNTSLNYYGGTLDELRTLIYTEK